MARSSNRVAGAGALQRVLCCSCSGSLDEYQTYTYTSTWRRISSTSAALFRGTLDHSQDGPQTEAIIAGFLIAILDQQRRHDPIEPVAVVLPPEQTHSTILPEANMVVPDLR